MHLSISSTSFSVLYCHIRIIKVCILFFNIFFFFCLKRTNLHIQTVLNVLSYIYTKKITKPIKQICDVTKEMQVLKEDAYCDINTGDEIELLSTNINSLYKN